jgi:hypothetical protein
MKLKDGLWISIILGVTLFILLPVTRTYFEYATQEAPYLMGFLKTGLLATMGELLVNRIKKGAYFSDQGIALKFFVWGLLGMTFVFVFQLFASGVASAQAKQMLLSISEPLFLGLLLTAFMTSLWMNLIFAPTFMMLHRITDGYIEKSQGQLKKLKNVKLSEVVISIDLNYFISFVVLKTIPFFWIPAHTITFLLPENYRVLMASYLSIALGIILTMAKQKQISNVKNT